MKNLCFIGDYVTDTGPGVANKLLKSGFVNTKNIYFSKKTNRLMRIFEALILVLKCKYIFLTSPSKLNIIIICISKALKKNTYYIMHGCMAYEDEINGKYELIDSDKCYEDYIFKNVNRILCVSKAFMEYMKEREVNYSNKFSFNYNCLDYEKLICFSNVSEYSCDILLVGGDMPRKNNLVVCEAIKKINKEYKLSLNCIVIGKDYGVANKFKNYDFVTYYEFMQRDELLALMKKSRLNILNSSFETFGLSILEGLLMGSSILMSKNVGSLGVFKKVHDNDIINNVNDINEISSKIILSLGTPNNLRLKNALILEYLIPEFSAKKLLEKVGINYEEYCK